MEEKTMFVLYTYNILKTFFYTKRKLNLKVSNIFYFKNNKDS